MKKLARLKWHKRQNHSAPVIDIEKRLEDEYSTIDKALEHLNNALHKNKQIQQIFIDLNNSKDSIKSKMVKQIYSDLTQNRANEVIFLKQKQNLAFQNLQKNEALFRAYRRLIEGTVSKVAWFYENQVTFSFVFPNIAELMKKVSVCARKGNKLLNLDMFNKAVKVIFDQNQRMEERIFDILLEKGYIFSIEEFYQINAYERENPDQFKGTEKRTQQEEKIVEYQRDPNSLNVPSIKRVVSHKARKKDVPIRQKRIENEEIIKGSKRSNQIQNKITNFFSEIVSKNSLKSNDVPEHTEKPRQISKFRTQIGSRRRSQKIQTLIGQVKGIETENFETSSKIVDLIQTVSHNSNRKSSFRQQKRRHKQTAQTFMRRSLIRRSMTKNSNFFADMSEFSRQRQRQLQPQQCSIINNNFINFPERGINKSRTGIDRTVKGSRHSTLNAIATNLSTPKLMDNYRESNPMKIFNNKTINTKLSSAKNGDSYTQSIVLELEEEIKHLLKIRGNKNKGSSAKLPSSKFYHFHMMQKLKNQFMNWYEPQKQNQKTEKSGEKSSKEESFDIKFYNEMIKKQSSNSSKWKTDAKNTPISQKKNDSKKNIRSTTGDPNKVRNRREAREYGNISNQSLNETLVKQSKMKHQRNYSQQEKQITFTPLSFGESQKRYKVYDTRRKVFIY